MSERRCLCEGVVSIKIETEWQLLRPPATNSSTSEEILVDPGLVGDGRTSGGSTATLKP